MEQWLLGRQPGGQGAGRTPAGTPYLRTREPQQQQENSQVNQFAKPYFENISRLNCQALQSVKNLDSAHAIPSLLVNGRIHISGYCLISGEIASHLFSLFFVWFRTRSMWAAERERIRIRRESTGSHVSSNLLSQNPFPFLPSSGDRSADERDDQRFGARQGSSACTPPLSCIVFCIQLDWVGRLWMQLLDVGQAGRWLRARLGAQLDEHRLRLGLWQQLLREGGAPYPNCKAETAR